MAGTPKDDEAKFNETLKRMLDTKPKPHKPPTEERPAKKGRAPKSKDQR